MASLTLSIPNEIKKNMADFKYINWSEIARTAILEKIEVLEKMDRLLTQSRLSEKESIDCGRRLKKKERARTERALK